MARSRRSSLRVIIGAPHVPSKWSRPASARAACGKPQGRSAGVFRVSSSGLDCRPGKRGRYRDRSAPNLLNFGYGLPQPREGFSWKSAPLGVLNNCQSRIHRRAHKSNERRTTTSTAHPTGHRSPATIAVDVSIKSVSRTVPAPVFASRVRLFRLPPHNPLDLNLGFVLAGLCQVKTDRHLWRNTGLAIHKVVERLPCHTQNVRSLGDRQTTRFDAVMPDGKPRMGRVFHRHGLAPHSSDTRLDQRHLCSPHQSEI